MSPVWNTTFIDTGRGLICLPLLALFFFIQTISLTSPDIRCHAPWGGELWGDGVVKRKGMEYFSFFLSASQSEYIMAQRKVFLALHSLCGAVNENQMHGNKKITNCKKIRIYCYSKSFSWRAREADLAFGPELQFQETRSGNEHYTSEAMLQGFCAPLRSHVSCSSKSDFR